MKFLLQSSLNWYPEKSLEPENDERPGITRLYEISYLYLGTTGFIVTVILKIYL